MYAAYMLFFSQRISLVAEPKYQKFREYLGVFSGLVLLRSAIQDGLQVHVPFWRGDNIAALSWAEKNKCRSKGGKWHT